MADPERVCPLCGAPVAVPVGPVFSGRTGMLWARRQFEERLYRCAEGHVYSVREERGRGGTRITREGHESLEGWLRTRTGTAPSARPPGL